MSRDEYTNSEGRLTGPEIFNGTRHMLHEKTQCARTSALACPHITPGWIGTFLVRRGIASTHRNCCSWSWFRPADRVCRGWLRYLRPMPGSPANCSIPMLPARGHSTGLAGSPKHFSLRWDDYLQGATIISLSKSSLSICQLSCFGRIVSASTSVTRGEDR